MIEFTNRPVFGVPLWKLPDVIEFVGDAPAAWIDDDIDVVVEQWAAEREAATLLIRTDREVGFMRDHVAQLVEFAESGM